MAIKLNKGYMPSTAILDIFLKVNNESNMTPVFMSGVTGEENEKKFVGIGEKEENGQRTYHLINLIVLGEGQDAMAIGGNVEGIPRTFPQAMTMLTEIINGKSASNNNGIAKASSELTKQNDGAKGFTSISEEENIQFMQTLAFKGYSLLFIAKKWGQGSFLNQYVGLAKKLGSQSDNVYLVNIDREQSTVDSQALDLPVALFRMAEEISK